MLGVLLAEEAVLGTTRSGAECTLNLPTTVQKAVHTCPWLKQGGAHKTLVTAKSRVGLSYYYTQQSSGLES